MWSSGPERSLNCSAGKVPGNAPVQVSQAAEGNEWITLGVACPAFEPRHEGGEAIGQHRHREPLAGVMPEDNGLHSQAGGMEGVVELQFARHEGVATGLTGDRDPFGTTSADDSHPAHLPVGGPGQMGSRCSQMGGELAGKLDDGEPRRREPHPAEAGKRSDRIGNQRRDGRKPGGGGELVVDPAGRRIPGGMATPDSHAGAGEIEEEATGRGGIGESGDGAEGEGMVGDDEVKILADRFINHGGRQRQAGEHPPDPFPPAANEQADRIPLRRQPQRGEMLQRGGHGGKRHHRLDHTICFWPSPSFRPRYHSMDRASVCIPAGALASDLRTAFRRARTLGVKGVELDVRAELDGGRISATGVRQLRKWLADEGLVVAALRFPTRGGYADSDRLEARIEGTKRALELAHGLGAHVVTNHVGPIPAEDSPAWGVLLGALRDLAGWSERAGATLCAEAGRASPADLLRLVAALPEGGLGCTLVTGALVVHGHDPAAAAAELAGIVRHVWLTDAVPGTFAGHGRATVLGRGDVDIAATLGALEERGYRGWLGLEVVDGSDAEGELAAAIARLALV